MHPYLPTPSNSPPFWFRTTGICFLLTPHSCWWRGSDSAEAAPGETQPQSRRGGGRRTPTGWALPWAVRDLPRGGSRGETEEKSANTPPYAGLRGSQVLRYPPPIFPDPARGGLTRVHVPYALSAHTRAAFPQGHPRCVNVFAHKLIPSKYPLVARPKISHPRGFSQPPR